MARFVACGEWCECFVEGALACQCVRVTDEGGLEAVVVHWGDPCQYPDAGQLSIDDLEGGDE